LVDESYQYLSEDGSENFEWDDVGSLLEESRRRQEQRLQEIEDQIRERNEIYEKYIGNLEDRIKVHRNRMQEADDTSKPFKEEVLAKLGDLYESLRGEMREKWRDVQKLEREKREIEKELDELKDAELLDSL
jgi:DNA repair exonuclease SbcCD ATPase subunit